MLDANINRAKEGLRVCEEVTRFIINDKGLSRSFKKLRHKIDTVVSDLPNKAALLAGREAAKDVGRKIKISQGLKRKNYRDVFFANFQRVKESIRVLEEFSKLENTDTALKFMAIRYDIYDLEKKAILKTCPRLKAKIDTTLK